jgi:hypothetical protein
MFHNKIITDKQQLQCAPRGIFPGFPENSAGWLIILQINLKALLSFAIPTSTKTSTLPYVLMHQSLFAPTSILMASETILQTLNLPLSPNWLRC